MPTNPGTANLIACYELEESAGSDAVDSHGNGPDIVDQNTVGRVTGIVGNAADCKDNAPSADQYFYNASTAAALQIGAGDFSIAFWVNVQTGPSGGGVYLEIFANGLGGGSSGGFVTRLTNTQMSGYLYNSTGSTYANNLYIGASWASRTGWHLYCFVHEASTSSWDLYYDSGGSITVQTGTYSSFTPANAPSNAPVRIGRDISNSGAQAYIDQIMLFDKALSQAEIEYLYNSGSGVDYDALNVIYPTAITTQTGQSAIVFENRDEVVSLLDISYGDFHNVENDRHGFGELAGFVPFASPEDAFLWSTQLKGKHLVVSNGAEKAFIGRIEDVSVEGPGLALTALGYQRALHDQPYTALWSCVSLDRWRVLTADDRSTTKSDPYQFDLLNRIGIALVKNAVYTTAHIGRVGISINDSLERLDMAYVEFDYDWFGPATMTASLQSTTGSFAAASPTSEWSLVGSGASQASSYSGSLTAGTRSLFFQIQPGSSTTITQETGDRYLRITNLRITASDGTVYADDIIDDIIDLVSTANPNHLSSETALVQSPTVDLDQAWFEDQSCADVLGILEKVGDNSTPPQPYNWRVGESEILEFAPLGENALIWGVHEADLELGFTLEGLINEAYAVYQSLIGEAIRTASNTDEALVADFGVTRTAPVFVDTSDATLAATVRDAFLEEMKHRTPLSRIRLDAIYTEPGQIVDPSAVQPGDTLKIIQFPPEGVEAVGENFLTFTIGRTRWNMTTGEFEVFPELDLRSIDVMLARALGAEV